MKNPIRTVAPFLICLLLAGPLHAAVVTSAEDSGAGSLRQTIADAVDGSIITFSNNLDGQTILLTNEISIDFDITLDATSLPGGLTISGGNTTRLFHINPGHTVSFQNINLINGNGVGELDNDVGGAIENQGILTLNRCTISGCSSSGSGGAIYNYLSTLTLVQCTISSNSAQYAGAIANGDNSVLALTNCTLSQNHATGTNDGYDGGGAIDNYGFATLNLNTCILAGNTAGTSTGSELWMESGSLITTNCLIGDGSDSTLVNGKKGNLVGTAGAPINALLAPLGNYGGPLPTMPPLPGSPAVDAASSINFMTDQRGYPLPVGLAPDIGAVEGIYNAAGPGKFINLTRLGDGSIQFDFTNYSDISFSALASTNIALPLKQWSNLGHVTETSPGSGLFQFKDTQAINHPQRFYSVQTP